MDSAITNLSSTTDGSKRWRTLLGRKDGEEISTKIMLAAIESLRRALNPEVWQPFHNVPLSQL